MVFNSVIVLSVAHVSVEAWQQIACLRLQNRFTAPQLLDLLCCFPLHQLGRFAVCLWTFLCLPPSDSFYSYSYSSSSSSADSDDSDDGGDIVFVVARNPLRRDGASSFSSSVSASTVASPYSSPVRIDDYIHHSHSD
ncbi:unnamed protein product [Linum tenue]|uniref:Uncharacterized protein n=1 Tax=Linum tenue TaxID=586396 RepID=A0AAV0M2E8_9ROSI|nr:unnamed protein product [Linum tenue]